ncbi:MAG: hypothetical protein K0S09_295 [Sphingobacteriaceae bacterium]|nr:hypothetical protein [Sphingobacteriaceae bacterium]
MQRKLRYRLRIFYAILLIMSAILTYDLFTEVITVWLALGGFGLGVVIGFAVGSISTVLWHEETSKVISKMDWAGGIVLLLYLSFSFSKKWIFGHWLHGEILSAFCFSTVAGIMLGRLISTRKQVKGILKEKGFLKN